MKWEIYKNLKFLRQEKNLTVDELSKLSGVSKAKILSIERELSFEHNIEQAKVEEVKSENCNNELHDEVQNYLEHVEEEKNKYDKDKN